MARYPTEPTVAEPGERAVDFRTIETFWNPLYCAEVRRISVHSRAYKDYTIKEAVDQCHHRCAKHTAEQLIRLPETKKCSVHKWAKYIDMAGKAYFVEVIV